MHLTNEQRTHIYKLPGTLKLLSPCGMDIAVPYSSMDEAFAIMKVYGEMGWISGEMPNGGYVFPYDYASSFDFAMIGGIEFTNKDGEACVRYRGQIFKRREYAATTGTKKMPAKIKYSRGARPGDPQHIIELDSNGKGYVTLISFVGGGKLSDKYLKTAPQAA